MNALKGAAVGFVLGIPLAIWGGYAGSDSAATQPEVAWILVGLLLGLPTLTSAALGFFAGRLEGARFPKLFGISLLLYWLDALVFALLIIFGDPKSGAHLGGLGGQLWGSFMLSLTGAALFSPFFVPVFGGLCFGLERWLRPEPPAEASSSDDPADAPAPSE